MHRNSSIAGSLRAIRYTSGASPFREIAFSPNSEKVAVSLNDAVIVYSIVH